MTLPRVYVIVLFYLLIALHRIYAENKAVKPCFVGTLGLTL